MDYVIDIEAALNSVEVMECKLMTGLFLREMCLRASALSKCCIVRQSCVSDR